MSKAEGVGRYDEWNKQNSICREAELGAVTVNKKEACQKVSQAENHKEDKGDFSYLVVEFHTWL